MIVDFVPVMDGGELLTEVQRLGYQVPCIVATAGNNSDTHLDGLLVNAVVPKPFELEQIAATVRDVSGN